MRITVQDHPMKSGWYASIDPVGTHGAWQGSRQMTPKAAFGTAMEEILRREQEAAKKPV